MGEIILLALAAAFFPTLIAAVVVILTRPHPARLLLGFWAGGFTMSMVAGYLVLNAFNAAESVAGTTPSTIDPTVYIVTGVLAVLMAGLAGTDRGRGLMGRYRHKRVKPSKAEQKDPWAQRVLDKGSVPVAFGVGAAINLPGPFYLVALGDISKDSYSTVEEILLMVVFNVIMFLMVEVPIVGYLVRPERTTVLVEEFSHWLHRNVVSIMSIIVAVTGVVLIYKGVSEN